MLRSVKLYGTTDDGTGGDLSVTFDHKVVGILKAVHWIDGSFTDGVDAVISISGDGDEADTTLLTLTDANSDAWYYPKLLACTAVGVDLDTAGDAQYEEMIVSGNLKLVVADGGATKTGGCIVYYEA